MLEPLGLVVREIQVSPSEEDGRGPVLPEGALDVIKTLQGWLHRTSG